MNDTLLKEMLKRSKVIAMVGVSAIKEKEDLYLCNGIHQYLAGNIYQANQINEIFLKSSLLTKID